MKLLIYFVIILLQIQFSFSKDMPVIKIDQSQKIDFVRRSDEYIIVVYTNKQTNRHGIDLYGKDGKNIFSLNGLEKRITHTWILPEINAYIYVLQGKFLEEEMQENDTFISRNIETGKINWEISIGPTLYEISKNKKYILTRNASTMQGGPSMFKIIKTIDGSEFLHKAIGEVFNAVWYDDDHVIFATQKNKRIPNPEYMELQAMKDKRKDFIKKRQKLAQEFRAGFISKQEYLEKEANLKTEINNNSREIKRRFTSSGPRKLSHQKFKSVSLPARIRLYNIKTDSFERDISIDGFRFGDVSIADAINIDKNKNLFILVDKNDSKIKESQTYILKLNSAFEIDWRKRLVTPYRLSLINYNNLLFFALNHNNNIYLININKELIPYDKIISNNILPNHINLRNIIRYSYNYIPYGLSIDRLNNKIKILNLGGE